MLDVWARCTSASPWASPGVPGRRVHDDEVPTPLPNPRSHEVRAGAEPLPGGRAVRTGMLRRRRSPRCWSDHGAGARSSARSRQRELGAVRVCVCVCLFVCVVLSWSVRRFALCSTLSPESVLAWAGIADPSARSSLLLSRSWLPAVAGAEPGAAPSWCTVPTVGTGGDGEVSHGAAPGPARDRLPSA